MARLASLRHYIDVVKALFEAQQPWGVSQSDMFEDSLKDNMIVFPDLREKLAKFVDVKCDNPLMARYGKHDRPFTGPLVGFWHCHLRDDAILIYNLKNRCVNLVAIVKHSDIEGKRAVKTGKRLRDYL